jgi:hypothetical protein
MVERLALRGVAPEKALSFAMMKLPAFRAEAAHSARAESPRRGDFYRTQRRA